MKSKKYQLKNGLKVLLLESRKSPVVSIQMWVKTGSADETKKMEGISHFIEHLVFKGTKKFKVGEIAQTIEGSGGELNAYTSFDQTVFYVTLSKDFMETGLEVISEMMGFPTFDPTEVDNEREVVVEEIKMGEDSPERQASQALFKTVYKKHPYGIPVIGYAGNIRKVKVSELKRYFHNRYVPKNMFLVVSGDFETGEMAKKVHRYFDGFTPYKLKTVKRHSEAQQKSPRIFVKKTDFKKSILYLAWRAPSVQHKDVPALDVMSLILGQGDSSRLAHKLRLDQPIVNGVGASAFTPRDPGFIAITMHLERKNLEKALEITSQEILRMIKEPVSNEEMQKAVNNLASEQIYSIETVDGIARNAGSMEFYTGDFKYFEKYIKQIYALKPSDIQRVAKKYFNPETLSIMLQTNEKEALAKKELTEFVKGLKTQTKLNEKDKNSKFTKAQKPFKSVKLKLGLASGATPIGTESWKHSSGIKVVYRKQGETPTVSLRVGFAGGARLDKIGREGQTELLSRTWGTGSKKFTEADINHRVDTMAASMSTFGGRNTIGVTCDFLSPFADPMLDIAEDTILAPLFLNENIKREKEVLIRQIKSRSDQPSSICMLEFMKGLFGDHPYGRDAYGTEDSLGKINSEELRQAYNQMVTPSNLTIAVVGDISKNKVEGFIERLSKALPDKKFKAPEFSLKTIQKDSFIFTESQKEQSHIVVGYRGLDIHDPMRFSLQILQSVLAGQGGRLFVELRDKNSLAYSVSPMRLEGLGTGYFGAYIGCSPEKAEKAIEMISHEFEKLTNDLISEEELLRAQRHLIGRHNIDLQRKSAVCQSLLLDTIYGIDPDETFHISDKYFLVTREQVLEAARRIFMQKRIISLVGPKSVSNRTNKSL